MTMKKVLLALSIIASLLMPAQAQAAETKFNGGPLTNLEATGSTIHIALSNVPAKGGLYILECVEAAAGTRPSVCNNAVQLWVSTAPGANFAPTADIQFKPTSTFTSGATSVDCTVSKCGIFIRFDHTVPNDLTEDQFIPLTFKAAAAGATTLPTDEITATLGGVALSTKVPVKLQYRAPATLAATSKAGAVLSYASFAPACTLVGNTVTALKGTGFCDIAVTSAGNATAAPVTAHFPIELSLGTQTLGNFVMPTTLAASKKVATPATTNFGAKISYKTTGGCTVSNGAISVKKGVCKIQVSAPGSAGLWKPLNQSFTIKGK